MMACQVAHPHTHENAAEATVACLVYAYLNLPGLVGALEAVLAHGKLHLLRLEPCSSLLYLSTQGAYSSCRHVLPSTCAHLATDPAHQHPQLGRDLFVLLHLTMCRRRLPTSSPGRWLLSRGQVSQPQPRRSGTASLTLLDGGASAAMTRPVPDLRSGFGFGLGSRLGIGVRCQVRVHHTPLAAIQSAAGVTPRSPAATALLPRRWPRGLAQKRRGPSLVRGSSCACTASFISTGRYVPCMGKGRAPYHCVPQRVW